MNVIISRKILALCLVTALVLSTVGLLFVSAGDGRGSYGEYLSLSEQSDPGLNQYIIRGPIRIDNDEDFFKQATEEDWPGDGTENDPYDISGFLIDGEDDGYCIFIGNTTVHFEVANNLLRNAQGGVGTYFRNAGIHLYNVDNGTLYDNTINNNFFGIYLEDSHETNTVSYNNIDTCYSGLILDGSDLNDLLNNEISNYTVHGISITNNSFGNDLIENIIQDGGNFGVHIIGESRANYLQRNIIMDNSVAGIYVLDGSTGTDLWVNTLENNEEYGIYLEADNSDLRTNEITGSDIGINIESQSNLVLRSDINDVSSRGIRVAGDENTIEDSTIDGVTDGMSYGILIHEEGSENVIIDNTISNTNHFAIGVLGDSIDNEIQDNLIFECDRGIVFGSVQIPGGNTAIGNVIRDITDEGIRIFASTETEVMNNELSNGEIGIYVRGAGSGPNNIEGNEISGFTDSGIKIEISDQGIINNTIYENFNGIDLDGGVNNQISENTIYDNINRGILLQDDSTDNHIDSNVILSNWQGIVFAGVNGNTVTNNLIKGSLSEGIRQAGSENLIFGNDFIENEVHAWDDNPNNWDDGDPNDGGSGGNYWDDDDNLDRGDGIGEDPYTDIEGGAGAQDRYPLVEAKNVEAEFILYDWSIDPDTVFIDEHVLIEGRVENIGHQTEVTDIDLYIGDMGSHIEREEVELAPGDITWVTFEGEPGEDWDIEEPGIYDVKVEPYHWPDNSWESELEIIAQEEFVLNDWSISPNPAYMFETVTIQGEVENIGGVEGFTEVYFYIDGTTIHGEDVELPPGQTEEVTFEGVPFDDWDIDESGIYDIKIELTHDPDEYWESELITHVFTDGDGTEEDPYLIEDWYHLDSVRYLLDAHYLLVNDLDENSAGYNELVGTADGWNPIGEGGAGSQFTGNFEGGEHEINDLFIDGDSYTGLFGVVGDGGVVANLGIIDLDVTGFELVGGLVGWNNVGTISNSYVTGEVSGAWAVGGLVGLSQEEAVISNSYSLVEVTGTDEKIGGLVGYNRGLISNSYASGEVTGEILVGGLVGDNWRGDIENSFASNDVTGIGGIGGLVGLTDEATISTSYATGDVTGEEGVGGFAAFNWGTIENSYSIGDVYRLSSSDDVEIGGVVGINNMGRIINCYSTGQVIYEDAENPTNKGFAGDVNTDGDYEMSNNFWDVDTSGQDSTAGNAAGKTTEEMQDYETFTDTDTEGLDEPWNIEILSGPHLDDDYPYLSWGTGNGPVWYIEQTTYAVSFEASVEDIVAGEQPIVEVYDAVDQFGDPLSGAYEVNIEIDGNVQDITISFAQGEMSVVWEPMTQADEYNAEVTIDGVDESDTFTVYPGEVDIVNISPIDDQTTVTAGEDLMFTAEAVDEYDNLITDDVTEFDWDGTEDGVFNEESAGYHDVTATYDGTTSAPVTITVVAGDVDYIEISPQDSTIYAGDSETYTAVAYDEYGNEIGDMTADTDWEIDAGAGGSWDDNNVYTSENAGTWTVTGTYEGETDEATLVVEDDETDFMPENLVLDVDPIEGDAPLEVTISVSGDNAGEEDGSIDVIVDGSVKHQLYMPAGESADHSFTHTFDEVGSYLIEFHDLSETVTVGDVPEFEPENLVLDVDPTSGEAPLEVTIFVSAENAGELGGEIDVIVDGSVEYILEIPAEGSADHTLTHTFDELGTYQIQFHDLTETVYVIDTAGFAPVDLELDVEPDSGEPPLTVTIFVSAENAGEEAGSIDVIVDGTVEYTLELPAEVSADHTFTHTFDQEGSYLIEFHDLSDTVVVSFEVETYTLTVTTDGDGTVEMDPDQEEYEEGTMVTLTAEADDGWEFVEWTGHASGNATSINVTMTEEMVVTAVFAEEEEVTPDDDDETGIMDLLSDYWWMLLALVILVILLMILVMMRGKKRGTDEQPYQQPPEEQPYQQPPEEQSYQQPPEEQSYQQPPEEQSYQQPPEEQSSKEPSEEPVNVETDGSSTKDDA